MTQFILHPLFSTFEINQIGEMLKPWAKFTDHYKIECISGNF